MVDEREFADALSGGDLCHAKDAFVGGNMHLQMPQRHDVERIGRFPGIDHGLLGLVPEGMGDSNDLGQLLAAESRERGAPGHAHAPLDIGEQDARAAFGPRDVFPGAACGDEPEISANLVG